MNEDTCESGVDKKTPKAIIILSYNEEVVIIKGDNKFTLHIDREGKLVGKQEKEIKM